MKKTRPAPQPIPLAPIVISVALKISGLLFWLAVVATVAITASSTLTGCGEPPVCQYDREASSPRAVARNLCATWWGDFETEAAIIAAVSSDHEVVLETTIIGSHAEVHIPNAEVREAAKEAGSDGYVIIMHNHTNMRYNKFSETDWKTKDSFYSLIKDAGSTLAYFGLVTPGPVISEYWEPLSAAEAVGNGMLQYQTYKQVLGW